MTSAIHVNFTHEIFLSACYVLNLSTYFVLLLDISYYFKTSPGQELHFLTFFGNSVLCNAMTALLWWVDT